jgi:hypothetical protein
MQPFQIFGVQAALSLLGYALIASWYVAPRRAALPLRAALLPLLVPHIFRTLGLVFIVPQVTDPHLPRDFAIPTAYGDLLAAILALASVIALRAGWRIAFGLVWLFNLAGTADLLYAIFQGVRVELPKFQLGPAWFIPTFLVPAALVIHTLVFIMLVRRAGEYRTTKRPILAKP